MVEENIKFLIIKGMVASDFVVSDKTLSIEYGIESFFVAENMGKEIERCGRVKCETDSNFFSRGESPFMHGRVAVDKNGSAVLKSLILSTGDEIN